MHFPNLVPDPVKLRECALGFGCRARPVRLTTPTQQDIRALEETLQTIPAMQGRAAVLGRFLRELGFDARAVVNAGNQLDLDFT